ncbi:MAG TPA: DUF739 family protein [Firmicutes bacterium]|nr:DUF739 family protein [Bacillota bacterium]
MHYDYSKLIGRIVEKKKTRRAFSQEIGMSERSLTLKLHGKTSWKQSEIEKACAILDIDPHEIPVYFFALKVQ